MDQDLIHIDRPDQSVVQVDAADARADGGSDDGGGEVGDLPLSGHSRKRRWIAVGVVGVIVAATLSYGWQQRGDVAPAATTIPTSTQPPPALSVAVFAAIVPSTVTITTGESPDAAVDGETGADPSGLGTGVIVNADGLILTALHVVAEAREIEVRFADGATSTAQLVVADPANDIALLEPDALPGIVVPAVLGDPRALRIGDEAYVVGNPVGLVASMSAGVISGLDRSSTAIGSDVLIDGLIQFDAAVNPGNSGGPLLNRRGEVVGIVTGLVNPSGAESFSGIGFAATITAAGGGLAPGQ